MAKSKATIKREAAEAAFEAHKATYDENYPEADRPAWIEEYNTLGRAVLALQKVK